MRAVHKYALPNVVNPLTITQGARLLHVDNQHEQITVWAEVDTEAPPCLRVLHVRGTGHEVPADTDYVGSALLDGGRFVFHVYASAEVIV